VTTTTGPTPAPITTTWAQVIFYHDNVASATPAGSYDVDYYYAGCLTLMDLGTAGITDVVWTAAKTAVAVDSGVDAGFVLKCGIDDNTACTHKTTYEYVVQDLDEINDSRIKTESLPDINNLVTNTVKFCIRHRMRSSTGQENGYKQADVTFTWKKNGNSFSGDVTTDVNDADNDTIDVGTVSLTVVRCAVSAPPPSNYQQGEVIQLCLSASVASSTPTPSAAVVTIVRVNALRFWIDISPDGNTGVYDVGETTQLGMVNGLPAGTTTILPVGAGTGTTYCTQPFGTNVYYSSAAMTGSGCVLSTFLAPAFFLPGTSTTTPVQYAGTVTIEFGDGSNRRRRVLSLRGDHHHRSAQQVSVGDEFDKPYASSVMITSADDRNDGSTCSCSGFFLFKIICWFFKCLLGFK
jgi:hypothetical protein